MRYDAQNILTISHTNSECVGYTVCTLHRKVHTTVYLMTIFYNNYRISAVTYYNFSVFSTLTSINGRCPSLSMLGLIPSGTSAFGFVRGKSL